MPFLAPIGVALGVGTAATATVAATGVVAASLVGGLALGAGGLLFKSLLTGPESPGQPAQPASLTSGADSSAAEIQKQADIAAQKNRLELARRKRTGTTLTSPQGLLSTEQSSQKTLLGG